MRAAVILGLVWAIWHLIGYAQTGNNASWIAGQCFYSAALRVLIVWVYNNAGQSVLAASLVHATSNTSWSMFPNYGSRYNPWVTGLIAWLAVLIVTLVWGPKTLARYRFGRRPPG